MTSIEAPSWRGNNRHGVVAVRMLPLCALAIAFATAANSAQNHRVDAAETSLTLKDIVESIRANEELLRNVELIYARRYEIGTPKYRFDDVISGSTGRSRFVLQDGKFFFMQQEKAISLDGALNSFGTLQGYDGNVTRVVEQEKVANIHDGRHDDVRFLRPHTMLLRDDSVLLPLSAFLSSKSYARFKLACNYVGIEQISDLQCFKIECLSWQKEGQKPDRRWIWLAPDRGYLPVRTEGFAAAYSETVPLVFAEVREYQELAPGVWIPQAAVRTVYDESWAREGKRIVSNVTTYELEKGSLNPNYPDSLFADIRVPDGIPVHRVVNGKIVSSAMSGSAANTDLARERAFVGWAGVLTLILLSGLVLYFLRKSRANPSQ